MIGAQRAFRPIVETCLDQFSPSRVMFGSNFPVDKLYSNYATLAHAHRDLVPREMHQAVFNDTAADFYSMFPWGVVRQNRLETDKAVS
ncbi:amidohydrolase family protein [Shimia sp.]|uniref:amidohydrolase family protein n=1 Tax=Shimia sp. TaxID=1954381 RepID=UPI00329A61B1